MIILVPYFGDTQRFRPLLDRWIAAYKASGCRVPWFALNEEPEAYELPSMRVNISGFRDLCRPGQPFDVKGALVCAALLQVTEPVLVLDADAFLAKDPMPALEPFRAAPVAMPLDHGALIFHRQAKLTAPFHCQKLCAGVQFFGEGADRSRLVAGYRRAFEEIMALPRLPWEPQLAHLVEQYAWSVCASRRGGLVLPAAMNWAPVHLGENPDVVVNHHYGHPKWSGTGMGAPANS